MSQKSGSKAVARKAAPFSSKSRATGSNDRWPTLGICVFLAAITWLVFGQTLRHDFVNFDDANYVLDNPQVTRGVTVEGIAWAFTHAHAANWHPVTWISHMLDCQFYGLSPGGHHLTNLLLHLTTAIMLLVILRQMTGSLWRSAFVAAVFAIHPLRVESVVWVAERNGGNEERPPAGLSVSVKMETPGLVVLADLWDKGWRAYLDGQRVPILRANHAVRGVLVPAGVRRQVGNTGGPNSGCLAGYHCAAVEEILH